MANQPVREFGKRRPVAMPAALPVKRSNHVALLLMGTFAVGGAAYALMPSQNCGQRPGLALDANAQCPPRGSSSGTSGSSSLRSSFFASDDLSGRQSSANSSEPASGKVTRGGFGGFAHAFAAHFSGGG